MVSGGRSRVTARCDVQQTPLERQLLNDNSTNIFYNLNNILIELNFAYFKEIFNLKYLGEICEKTMVVNAETDLQLNEDIVVKSAICLVKCRPLRNCNIDGIVYKL